MKPYQLIIIDAINALTDNNFKTFVGTDLSTVEVTDDYTGNVPTEAEIQSKIDELMPAFAMDALREERNKLLKETDWTQSEDVPSATKTTWTTYRQSLRDLPANTENPVVGTDGLLTGVTWPTKPE